MLGVGTILAIVAASMIPPVIVYALARGSLKSLPPPPEDGDPLDSNFASSVPPKPNKPDAGPEEDVEEPGEEEGNLADRPTLRMTEDDWAREMEELYEHLHKFDYRLRDVVEDLTGHVKFTRQVEIIGYEKFTGDQIGMTVQEVPYPADDVEIQPISPGAFHDMHRLLPSELAADEETLMMRVITGEALISVYLEDAPLMEEIHRPKFKEKLRALNVTWDASPSMFPEWGEGWRIPVMQGVLLRLLDKALRARVPFIGRPFGWQLGRDRRVVNIPQGIEFLRWIRDTPPKIDGTNITNAIYRGIADLQTVEYDEGDLVIITDGEAGENIDPAEIRRALKGANLKLHAIMLGVENEELRKCCDVYQIVERDLTIHDPVRQFQA